MAADIVWKTTRLPDAIVGVAYQAGLGWGGQATALTALSASGLPASNNLACTLAGGGVITGTPTHADVGMYTVTVTATDTAGASVSGSLTLNVRFAQTADVNNSDYEALSGLNANFAADNARLWPLSH